MELNLKNKKAVILASTDGLGKSIAKNLFEEGCHIAICSRSAEKVNNTISEFKQISNAQTVIGKSVDLSVNEQIDDFFSMIKREFDEVDILVTNSGGPPTGKFEKFEDDAWYNAFDLNFMSAIRSIRHVLPSMKKNGWGRIIAITSISVKTPIENLMLSNSIRAGLTGFLKTLSNEVAPFNVTVNSVCPGYIFTNRVQNLSQNEAKRTGLNSNEVIKNWENKIPMQRMGRPDEFASLVAYLCSEKAGYITGSTYWMDGGRYNGLM